MARAMEKSILGVSGGIVRTLMRMKAITLQMGEEKLDLQLDCFRVEILQVDKMERKVLMLCSCFKAFGNFTKPAKQNPTHPDIQPLHNSIHICFAVLPSSSFFPLFSPVHTACF